MVINCLKRINLGFNRGHGFGRDHGIDNGLFYSFFINMTGRFSGSLLPNAYRLTCTGGIRSFQGMAASKAAAMRIKADSSPKGAANCTPMGKPDSLNPNGNETEGVPVTLKSPMC